MKHLCLVATLFLMAFNLSAQTVKIKKDIIYVDDAPAFSIIKKAMGNELYVYKLNSSDELVNIVVDNNNTESKVDDGKKINFVKQNIFIQSQTFRSRNWEFLISLLLQEKVFDVKGEVNEDNLKRFKAKYDEHNVNHTMMR